MSVPVDREFITQAIIVLGACLGSWVIFVQPKAEKLHQVEAVVEQGRVQAAARNHASIEKIANYAPKLRARCDEIELRSRLSRDSAVLYGQIMALATDAGVNVKNLQPRVERDVSGARMAVTQIDMTVEADFERIAAFLESLDTIGAYLRQSSLQITPAGRGDKPYAVVQVSCEALSFKVPEAMAHVRGGDR